MNIGILGFGTVGQGVYKILTSKADKITALIGEKILIKKILVRDIHKPRNVEIEPDLLTDDYSEVLEDQDIDMILELTSSKDMSVDYMKHAIQNGKGVVTANKAALAEAYGELAYLSNKSGGKLLFEAAVAGGVPLIASILNRLNFEIIEHMQGIVNGSSNYILSELSKGRERKEVIKEASNIGVLEEDPSDDILGYDATRKLIILIDLFLGTSIRFDELPCIGIERIENQDIEFLNDKGLTVKLIAEYKKISSSEYSASVMPRALKKENEFSKVDDIFNMIIIKGEYFGSLSFSGMGGGMLPTADAVVSDIISLVKNKGQKLPISGKFYNNVVDTEISQYYIRSKSMHQEIVSLSAKEAIDIYKKGYCIIKMED